MRSKKASLWLTLTAGVVVLLTVGMIYLRADLHTYEQRYADCMEIQKSWMPNNELFYPSLAYDRASRECEEQANAG